MASQARSGVGNGSRRYTTLDLVIIAVLGVVFGVLNTPFGVLFQFLQSTFGPAGQALFAPWAIGMALTTFIVRKPGAGFLNGLINGLFRVLSGNPAGLVNLGWGFALGLGVDIGFAIDTYVLRGGGRFTWLTAVLAGGIATGLSYLVSVVAYDYASAGMTVLLLSWLGQAVAGAVESGLVALAIGKILEQSGMLKSFAAGRSRSATARA